MIAGGFISGLMAPGTGVVAAADSPWLQLFGRLHPVLVHFPIALVIAALGLEVLRLARRRQNPSPGALTCLGLGVLGAGPAIGAGWLNADFEPHAASVTMEWHRWLAIFGGSIALVALVLGHGARRYQRWQLRRAYVFFLALAASGIGVAGHLGGTLVYGEGYYAEPIERLLGGRSEPADDRLGFVRTPPPGVTLTVDFARDIAPIFNERCVECHGPTKAKRKLRLDQPELMFRGPAEDWVVQPGKPDESELARLIRLPADDPDRMPPEGEPLTSRQTSLIERWIAEGAYWRPEARPAQPASTSSTSPATAPPGASAPATTKPAGSSTPEPGGSPQPVRVIPIRPVPEISEAERKAIEALRELGATILPLHEGSLVVQANLGRMSAEAAPKALAALAVVGDRVVSLDLSGLSLTPADLRAIGSRRMLTNLVLARTTLVDDDVRLLTGLDALQVLNLVGTKVTDASVDVIAGLPALIRVYLWETGVTEEGVNRLARLRPTVEVIRDE
ncbi:MAG: DUF2231 domain-containing protein [Phycisphaerales bacterium]